MASQPSREAGSPDRRLQSMRVADASDKGRTIVFPAGLEANDPAAARVSPFPFSAIVGQDDLKLSLLIVAVDPTIGGVLIFGDRGTGKSTAVRALANLLPQVRVIADCRYNCDPGAKRALCKDCQARRGVLKTRMIAAPMVELPLGATEDRVVGSLDIERALSHGEKSFQPGLLAKANRGFLYIDEVNLLSTLR